MKEYLSLTGLVRFYENLKKIISGLQKSSHTHDNKSVLDSITENQQNNIASLTEQNWSGIKNLTPARLAALEAKSHMHVNSDVLAELNYRSFNDSNPNIINSLKTANILKRIDILESSIGMSKSKNLLKIDNKSVTTNGIEFASYSDDGVITCNGTATNVAFFTINIKNMLPSNNDLILSGCPTGGSGTSSYAMRIEGDSGVIATDTGSGVTIKSTDIVRATKIVIRIAKGYVADHLKFYPMLRNAVTYAGDSTYEPYITDDLQTQINSAVMDSGWIRAGISNGSGELYYRRYGKMVEVKGSLSSNISGGWTVYTLPAGYRPSTVAVYALAIGNNPRNFSISIEGVITISNVVNHELIYLQTCFLVD